jgi:hypothetical protein
MEDKSSKEHVCLNVFFCQTRLPVSERCAENLSFRVAQYVTLHRKVKTWPFGSAKWFWPSIFPQFAAVGSLSSTGEFSSNPFFEKYDFDPLEGFSIKKTGPNSPDFEKKKCYQSSDF